ncbi:MAG: nucleotide exchange factor GrpE [Thermoplasmata archaeon]|nr:nucleotide exchange factor GrpE [Thermoplasmata archaeon]
MSEEKAKPDAPPEEPPQGAPPNATTPPALSEPGMPVAADEATSPTGSPEEPGPDWETRFKYLFADFENYRKRGERDREGARVRAEAELLKELLPIHDAFERARESSKSAAASDPIRKGLELLSKEWDGFLAREGVRSLAKPGGSFNADEHEAVAEAPVRPGHAAGTIVEIVQQGYRFRGGLLRPAKVVVARTPPPAAAAEEKASGGIAGSGTSE